jgi:hypothetical protein
MSTTVSRRAAVEADVRAVLALVRRSARDDYLGFARAGDDAIDQATVQLTSIIVRLVAEATTLPGDP